MLNKFEIKEINWKDTVPVRHEVLWPNKPPEFCHIPKDDEGWHFGVYIDDELSSVASVYPDGKSARLRKFATLQEYQGQGIGSALLNHILSFVKEKETKYFWCDARESAIGFYERFGMRREGECFYKSNIPYYKMGIAL